MDSKSVNRAWSNWVSSKVGSSSNNPLKAALLINYDPNGPSRLLSTIAEQEGIDLYTVELKQFIDFMKRGSLPTEDFVIGSKQCKFDLMGAVSEFVVGLSDRDLIGFVDLVTTVHEDWFAARCLNTTEPAGEGVIVMQTAVYVLVALYDGSIGSASQAMAAADEFASQLLAMKY